MLDAVCGAPCLSLNVPCSMNSLEGKACVMKRSVFVLAVGVMLMVASAAGQQLQLMEPSIDEIHRGLHSGKLTCHSLVQQYLDRIKAYDQQGPTLNAMLYVNPNVLEQADAMDKLLKRGTRLKPLQCIPMVLK